MDWQSIQPLFTWLSEHPAWSGLFVFLIAFSESLFVIGIIVPGTILMFGVGTLVGTGVLDIQDTLLIAFLGAVAGDGVSYWIGVRYHHQFESIWPLKNNPHHIEHGKSYFKKHGGKSVFFGRFIGPVRPFIPAIAGMMGMPVKYFIFVNVLSAAIWSPFYLLPGIVFGSSIDLALIVGARLIVFFLAMFFFWLLIVWLVRKLMLFIKPEILLSLIVVVILLGGGFWSVKYFSNTDEYKVVSMQEWNSGLSAQLTDPSQLNIHWMGGLDGIKKTLLNSGWQQATIADYQTILYWMKPDVNLQELPRFPQRKNGKYEALVMIKYFDDQHFAKVLQLWPAFYAIENNEVPLWVGSLTRQSISSIADTLPLLRVESLSFSELGEFKGFVMAQGFDVKRSSDENILLISHGVENEK